MGTQRYGISLGVFNSTPLEWAQHISARQRITLLHKHVTNKKKSTSFMFQKEKALPFIHGAKWSKWCISSWLAISNVKIFYHFSPVEILHTWFISVVEILHICIYLSNSNNFQFNLRNVLVLKRINYRISTTAIIISPFLWLM